MPKSIKLYFIVIICLLLAIFATCGNQQNSKKQPEKRAAKITTHQLEPWYEIYFSHVYSGNPQEAKQDPTNIDKMLAKKIASAKASISAALHELDSNLITEALIKAHQHGVKLRLLTETDYMDEESIKELQEVGIPVKNDSGRGGLMHNKFLIFDRQAVWTGSFNTTDNGAYKNNNNAIYIHSEKLAYNFTAEFNEMFEQNQFGRTSEKAIPHPKVTMPDKTEIITLFSPENDVLDAIIAEINKARQSIFFMAFSFTHEGIGQAMIEKYKASVDVKGVFETRNSDTAYSQYPKMKAMGIPVKQDTNKYILHHKVIIIDSETVITGSFNFSQNAAKTNEENILIIKGNTNIANTYLSEFKRLYEQEAPLITTPSENLTKVENTTKININTADASELMQLPSIGETIAQRILEYRQRNGQFTNLHSLTKVKGIGKYSQNLPNLPLV
jgi:competence ComEA-like helix-hairpin-helix protein